MKKSPMFLFFKINNGIIRPIFRTFVVLFTPCDAPPLTKVEFSEPQVTWPLTSSPERGSLRVDSLDVTRRIKYGQMHCAHVFAISLIVLIPVIVSENKFCFWAVYAQQSRGNYLSLYYLVIVVYKSNTCMHNKGLYHVHKI